MESLFFGFVSMLFNFVSSEISQSNAQSAAFDQSFLGQLQKYQTRLNNSFTHTEDGRRVADDGWYNAEDSYWRGVTGSGLTNAQIQQNEFNANQAQLQRDWLQDLYSRRNQIAVDDMSAAGLNPAMMYGGGQSPASVPSASSASGGSPGNPSPMDAGSGAIGSIMQGLASSFLAMSQSKLNLAEARKMNASAENIEITNLTQDELNRAQLRLWQSEGDLTYSKIGQVLQDIRTGRADEALKLAGVERTEAETDMLFLQQIEQRITNDNRQELIDLQKQLMSSEIDVNSERYNEIRANIGKIYAETLTEAYKQGALSAEASKDFAQAGFLAAETTGVNIDNSYRNLANKVDIAVKITEGFKNTTSGISDVNDVVSSWIPAPGKILRKIVNNR